MSSAAAKMMRAVVMDGVGGPEVLKIAQVPMPRLIHDSQQVLIKVAATAANRADTMQRKGNYPAPVGASPILGLECAGTVVETGSKVSRWKEGDRVMALLSGGGYSEYCLAHEAHCMPVPAGVALEEAAAVPEAYLTAYQTLSIAGISHKQSSNKNCLFHGGASGVGTAFCQIVNAFGCTPVVTASKDKLDNAILQALCKHRFQRDNAEGEALPKWVADIEASPLGKASIDCIVDPVVGSGYLSGDVSVLKTDGTIVILAMMAGAVIPKFDIRPVFAKRARIQASTLRSRSDEYKAELVAEFMKNFGNIYLWKNAAAASSGGEEGATSSPIVAPVISMTTSIENVVEVHKAMDASETIGKVVMKW